MMRISLLVAVVLLAVAAPLNAVRIEISNPNIRPYKVYAPPYSDKGGAALSAKILANLRLLANIELADSKETADYQLSFSEDSDNFNAVVNDLKSGESYAFKVRNFRAESVGNAYLLTDRIYEKITQTPGFFSTRLAFSMNWYGVRQVFIADILGKRIQRLTDNATDSIAPKIAPDRKHLVYMQYNRKGGTSLRMIDLDELKDELMYTSDEMNIPGGFREDGRSFYYTSYDGKTSKLYEFVLRERTRKLLQTSRARLVSPVPTYGTEQIAYVSDELGSPQVFLFPLKGGAGKRLTRNHKYATSPSFSRQGRHYVYLGQVGSGNSVFVSSVDGAEFAPLATNRKYEDPIWLASERYVLTHALEKNNSVLFLIDIPTQKMIKLFSVPAQLAYLSAG